MTSTSKFFKTFHGGADGSPRQSGCAREELQTSPSPIETPVGRVSVDELQGDNQAGEPLIRGVLGSRCQFHPAIASLSPGNGFPRPPFYAALPRIGISLRSLDRARPTLRVSTLGRPVHLVRPRPVEFRPHTPEPGTNELCTSAQSRDAGPPHPGR